MHGDGDAIDVEGHPELEQLAAEVCASAQPRILRRNGREVARVVPTSGHGQEPIPEAMSAFDRAFGSWAGVDVTKFVDEIYSWRDVGGYKPRIEL